jgi:hypothetical protein
LRFFIDSSQRSQYALQQWEKFTVPDTHEVSPFSKNTYHVFVQLEDDSVIAEGATFLTGKHFTNSTLIQMDKEGNYLVVLSFSFSPIKVFFEKSEPRLHPSMETFSIFEFLGTRSQ